MNGGVVDQLPPHGSGVDPLMDAVALRLDRTTAFPAPDHENQDSIPIDKVEGEAIQGTESLSGPQKFFEETQNWECWQACVRRAVTAVEDTGLSHWAESLHTCRG